MNRLISKKRLTHLVLALTAAGLVACSSPEEKVASFYQKGKNYLEQGDNAKARLEFQNALQINPNMVPAIYGLAEIAERASDWQRAFGLLSKVVEIDAKHLDAQVKLGKLLLAAGQLDKALAASDATRALSPDSAEVLALRGAVLFKLDDRAGAIDFANQALAKDPQNIDALVVLASERLQAGDAENAVKFLDRGLAGNEKNVALQLIKVQALEKLSKVDGAEEIFKKLISFYPDNKAFRHILAQFYMIHGQKDKAEAEYRQVAANNPKDQEAKLDIIRFVNTVRGTDAAIAELNKLIEAEPGNFELRFAQASLQQSINQGEASEKTLRDIVSKAGEDPAGIRARGILAGMLLAKGDKAAATALVAEILTKDARNEQGLLLRSSIAIDDGRLEDAVADLRTILRDVPDSARAHTLLAKAHELQGSKDLAGDHYARAFQAGKLAPPFGMAYAQFLLKSGKPKHAEDVLKEVLRVTPQYVPALRLLAQSYLGSGNLAGAQAVADEVAKMSNEGVTANQIQGAVYAARKNFDNSISAFKRAYELSPSEMQPMVALVRSYLRAGKTKEAVSFMQSVVEASPKNVEARLLLGQLYLQTGNKEAAQQSFSSVIELDPKNVAGYQGMVAMYVANNRLDDAERVIKDGLKASPSDFGLRLSLAGVYESAGKVDEAIALYEQLLKEKPNADVVANNLASLLSEYRTDKASLDRAHLLAQRLKNSDIPQFKDTLGWASYKVGKYDDATSLLKSAAQQMPDLAVIQFHLGMSQLAANNKEEARKSLTRSLEMAKTQPFAQSEEAKKALQGL